MSFVGAVGTTGGAEIVMCDENAGVIGVVCTVVETTAGSVCIVVAVVATAASGAVLVDMASLVASSMHFLASLNFISTFPNSAFSSRS